MHMRNNVDDMCDTSRNEPKSVLLFFSRPVIRCGVLNLSALLEKSSKPLRSCTLQGARVEKGPAAGSAGGSIAIVFLAVGFAM